MNNLILRLDYASLKYSPSRKVIRAIKRELKRINEYPDESYYDLKKELAIVFALKQSSFIAGNGADEIIDLITRAFAKSGDEVVIPTPTFSQFEEAAKRVKAQAILLNCMQNGQYEIQKEKILSAVSSKTKLIWLCSPNNPTGDSISLATLDGILRNVRIPVALDVCLDDFEKRSFTNLVRKYKNLIIVKSMSKKYCLAGLRIGFAAADPKLIKKLEQMRQIFNVNRLAVVASITALRDRAYYDKLWSRFERQKKKLAAKISSLGIRIANKESNFLLLDFKDELLAEKVYRKLLSSGIKIFPGTDPEFSGLSGRFCRVTVGRKKENKIFIKCLTKIWRELR